MNYSDNPGHCRVDFFKESGKWYDTVTIDMSSLYNEPFIHNAVKFAVHQAVGKRYIGMWAVCLKPYHKNEYPVMFVWKGLEI